MKENKSTPTIIVVKTKHTREKVYVTLKRAEVPKAPPHKRTYQAVTRYCAESVVEEASESVSEDCSEVLSEEP